MQLLRRQSVRRKARPDRLDHPRRSRSVHLELSERREVSENGLMHKSEPGLLDILLRIDGDILTCTITDNGVGRIVAAAASSKSAQKRKSMGIDITQQRLNLINGSADNGHGVKIEDLYDDHGQPAGTRVTIRIHTRTSQSFINQQL